MRTSKPPPRVHIQEKRGSNVAAANGTLRHGGNPLSALLCRGASIASMELRAERLKTPGQDLGCRNPRGFCEGAGSDFYAGGSDVRRRDTALLTNGRAALRLTLTREESAIYG